MNILFPFLVQISLLVLLYNSRPFVLICTLILPFQIPSFTSKTFLALVSLQLFHLTFLLLFDFFLYFSLFSCSFHTEVDILLSLPLPFSFLSQFQGYVPLVMVSLRLLQFFPDYIYPSLLVLYVPYSTSCILFHILPFFCCYLFYLHF